MLGVSTRKVCSKCGEKKKGEKFSPDRRNSDGLQGQCKKCKREIRSSKIFAGVLPEDKLCKKCDLRKPSSEFPKCRHNGLQHQCKKCVNARKLNWRVRTKYRTDKKYELEHPEIRRKAKAIYLQKNKHLPKYKLNNTMRRTIWNMLRGNKNRRKWEKLVGYSVKDLKKHLERQFIDGMSWDNYGEWHIDHKIPVAVFNFDHPDEIDFKRCWALENLQPMWASENIAKRAKIDMPFQPMLKLRTG